MWEAGREGKGTKGPLAGATEWPAIQLSVTQQVQVSHSPWLQIRWFGDGLVETQSAHKPVRVLSTLALGKHKRGGLGQTRVRDGESLGLGETGRPYICRDPYKAAECGPRTFSSVRPRHSIWKPWSRAQRIRTVLTFTWMR